MNSRNTAFYLLVFYLFSFVPGAAEAADALIEKVIYQEKDASRAAVIFHLNGPHLPKAFVMKGDNPRIVFDFMQTRPFWSLPSNILAGGSIVRKIRMGIHPDKTRVVIDLVFPGEYHFDQKFDKDENILTILLVATDLSPKSAVPVSSVTPEKEVHSRFVSSQESLASQSVAEESVKAGAQTENKAAELEVLASAPPLLEVLVTEENAEVKEGAEPVPDPLLSEVSFENRSNNGEIVLFKLNGFYPPTVSGEEDGIPRVICEFPDTRLGKAVVRDLASHGKYVERIWVEQFSDPDRVQVVLDLFPNKNYDLQQVFFKENNLFIIIVNSYDTLDSKRDPMP
jgi:AMIN domain